MENKREKLMDFCRKQCFSNGSCKACPLNDAKQKWKSPLPTLVNCLYIDISPEEDLNKALAIIDPVKNNPLWERICKIAEAQRERWIESYGKGLERDTAEVDIRLHRIEEELIDALMYIEHLKDAIVKKEADNA